MFCVCVSGLVSGRLWSERRLIIFFQISLPEAGFLFSCISLISNCKCCACGLNEWLTIWNQWFSKWVDFFPGVLWPYPEAFLVVILSGESYCHLISRGQGYCSTFYKAAAPQERIIYPKMSIVPEFENSALNFMPNCHNSLTWLKWNTYLWN